MERNWEGAETERCGNGNGSGKGRGIRKGN